MNIELSTFLSNHLEILAEKMGEDLFQNSSPFSKRIIIVPTPFMKSWLLWNMANNPKIGIACGVEIYTLNQSLPKIVSLFDDKELFFEKILSPADLSLVVESEIRQVIKETNSRNNELWKPLLNYLGIDKTSFTKRSHQRLLSLCLTLGDLFHEYGIFGSKVTQNWIKDPLIGWQEELWLRIFQKKNSYLNLNQIVSQWEKKNFFKPNIPEFHLHLFGLSFLSETHIRFFLHLHKYIPLRFYLISPTKEFWSEQRTQKEAYSFQKRHTFKTQESYLDQTNIILENFGKLGRHLIRALEDNSTTLTSLYSLPFSVNNHAQYDLEDENLVFDDSINSFTLLKALQADLITLRNPENDSPIILNENDDSIELHQAPSKMREVEILYHNLLRLIERHLKKEDTLYPRDILVMAPDILVYESAIRAVFGSPESKLDFILHDLPPQSQSSLVQAFLHLLQMAQSRWESTLMLTFFEFPAVQRKFKISPEDSKKFEKWVREGQVLWGRNSKHKREKLRSIYNISFETPDISNGTWEHSFRRMALGTAMILPLDELQKETCSDNIFPLFVEGTQTEILGEWILLIKILQNELQPIEQNVSQSLLEWSGYLTQLFETFLAPDYEDIGSIEEYEQFKKQLAGLFKKGLLKEEKFNWQTVEKHLLSKIQSEKVSYRENHIQAIRFCSLLPMRSIPSKVIALIGMDEEAFPKRVTPNSLNLLSGNSQSDYSPSPIDYDHYLFLETLLSAREHLLLSYSHESKAKSLPSPVISEILNYMDQCFLLGNEKPSKKCVIYHPFHSFDTRYFNSKNKKLCSYSSINYELAQVLKKQKEIPPNPSFLQIPKYFIKQEIPPQVDLKQLSQTARNPFETYFNNSLGIYLDEEEEKNDREDNEFSLDALEIFKLKKLALNVPIENVLEIAQGQGKLSQGLFKEVICQRVKDESMLWKEHLKQRGILLEDLISIEFRKGCSRKEQLEKNYWVCPPIEILGCQIIGTLSNLTSEGILFYQEGNSRDIYKAWPHLLVYRHLRKMNFDFKPQVLWLKSNKIYSLELLETAKYLENYLYYYSFCLKNISLLIPEWVDSILNMELHSFKRKVSQTFSYTRQNLYNDYIFKAITDKQIEEMTIEEFLRWKELAQGIFKQENS